MDFIPLAKPNILDSDIAEVSRVLRSGMLVQGIEVCELEKNIANYISTKHASAVSNGTASLHLALIALGIKPDDEVIVPAFSYMATANVVELIGATPVFVDIDVATFNIDVTKIESVITKNTKAIIPVHEFGLACDIEAVIAIAKKHNLFVIEDAACALGAKQNNKPVGSFGEFGSFSFHPRKAITSGEGGILTTNNPNYAKKIEILRNHGIEMADLKMEFIEAGFNYRLTDFQAVLVNSQFKRIEQGLAYKQKLADLYLSSIKNSKVTLPVIPGDRNHTWQSFHIVFNDKINRDEVILHLKNKNIGSNYGAQCMPFQKYYLDKYKLNCAELFPNAMTAYTKGLAIPMHELLTEDHVKYISSTINEL